MRDLIQEYKVLSLIHSTTVSSTTTGSAVDVEIYNDDAVVVVDMGAFIGTPSFIVTVTGSLTATPTVYDQTLATFVAATAAGIGAANLNLAGIKNIKGVATLTSTTSASISISVLAELGTKATGTNSTTLA